MGRTIGIDLGTTNSCVAALEGADVQVIPNAEGSRTTPSVVAYTLAGERLVGAPAKRQAVTNPERTIFSVKRFMGRGPDEVSEEMKIVPYGVTTSDNGDVLIQVGDDRLTPQELSAAILSKLRADAEAYLGEEVTDAVITVPAYFNDAQRQATKDAGRIAGLNVLRIINEPTAAALAYGLERTDDQIVLVFDLGGGTFDVSVLEISDGVWEVRSTSGDNHLGGDDFDKALVDYLAETFKAEHGVDLAADRLALQRLYDAAERAKVELSSVQSTQVNLPFITSDASGPLHLDVQITRQQLETVAQHLLARLDAPTRRAIEDADLDGESIDHVVLVGGMSRMPAVQEHVSQITGLAPHRGVNPDEVVALGAAIQGGVMGGLVKDVLLLDVTPLSLGIETRGGVFQALIERNTTIPTMRSEVFSTAVDNQPNVEIHALQGESDLARYNKSLGRFQLDVPAAPAGQPLIEVAFDIDANGIIKVSATDQATGASQEVRIAGAGGLGEEEIQRLTKAAAEHADEARSARELQAAMGQSLSRLRLLARQDTGEREQASDIAKLLEAADSVEQVDALSPRIDELARRSAERARAQREAPKEAEPVAPAEDEVTDVEVIDEDTA